MKKALSVLYRRLNKFLKLSLREKWFLAEAVILLGAGRLTVLLFPFSIIKKHIEKDIGSSVRPKNNNDSETVRLVKWSVQCMSRYTPWKSKCFAQAIAAQRMLRKRGITSTMHFGVDKDSEGGLVAHAWLKCGVLVVTGNQGMKRFKEVVYIGNNVGNDINLL